MVKLYTIDEVRYVLLGNSLFREVEAKEIAEAEFESAVPAERRPICGTCGLPGIHGHPELSTRRSRI